jgi:hypothetical protein
MSITRPSVDLTNHILMSRHKKWREEMKQSQRERNVPKQIIEKWLRDPNTGDGEYHFGWFTPVRYGFDIGTFNLHFKEEVEGVKLEFYLKKKPYKTKYTRVVKINDRYYYLTR